MPQKQVFRPRVWLPSTAPVTGAATFTRLYPRGACRNSQLIMVSLFIPSVNTVGLFFSYPVEVFARGVVGSAHSTHPFCCLSSSASKGQDSFLPRGPVRRWVRIFFPTPHLLIKLTIFSWIFSRLHANLRHRLHLFN